MSTDKCYLRQSKKDCMLETPVTSGHFQRNSLLLFNFTSNY